MNGVSLQYDIDVTPMLERLHKLDKLSFDKLLNNIGGYMIGQIQDRFDGQKLWDNSPMPQSAAAAARGGKTLIDHHHLYDSYTYQLIDNGVAIGSNSVYARIHHFGGDTGRGGKTHIEARPVLGVNDRDEKIIGDMLVKAIGTA